MIDTGFYHGGEMSLGRMWHSSRRLRGRLSARGELWLIFCLVRSGSWRIFMVLCTWGEVIVVVSYVVEWKDEGPSQ